MAKTDLFLVTRAMAQGGHGPMPLNMPLCLEHQFASVDRSHSTKMGDNGDGVRMEQISVPVLKVKLKVTVRYLARSRSEQSYTMIGILDLSAAFDCVDHSISS